MYRGYKNRAIQTGDSNSGEIEAGESESGNTSYTQNDGQWTFLSPWAERRMLLEFSIKFRMLKASEIWEIRRKKK